MYLQFCIRGYAMTQFSIALLLMEGCAFAYHNRKKMKKEHFGNIFLFGETKFAGKSFGPK